MTIGRSVGAFALSYALAVAASLPRSGGSRQLCDVTNDALVYTATLDSLVRSGKVIILTDSDYHLSSIACSDALHEVHTRLPVRVVAHDSLGSAHESGVSGFWAQFHTKFPDADGLYALSQIRYSDSSHAALNYSHHCGGRCGDGGIVVLIRRGTSWTVTKITIEWMS
jgi:hypothetical protein